MTYNNANNINQHCISLEFYYNYYMYIFYKKDNNLYLKFKLIYILVAGLENKIFVNIIFFNVFKSFKNGLTIKLLSLSAIFLEAKF